VYLRDRRLSEPYFLSDLTQTLAKLKDTSGDMDARLLAADLDVMEAEFCCHV
jgi:hypothetical protein